ncbi:MAG: hypothetical protein M1833_000541 [Piccolia ochrophora]|nr:MAG: hypothetical protein M1833_000541 [Piccolia ochrophora]
MTYDADNIGPPTRKTRIVCVSDTHNASPFNGAFKLPKGDVLIHAGDITNQGSITELKRSVEWIEKAEFEAKIVIGGNHDITLDADFYGQYGASFHNQHPQDPDACAALFARSSTITYLQHQSTVIRLQAPTGPRTTFKVFGSPYSPAHGLWAFGYPLEDASRLWNDITPDTDIVVAHTPAKHYCDETRGRGAAGCEELRKKLLNVRPRLAVCGHIHEGRGCERITWESISPHMGWKEKDRTRWVDTGRNNNKQSLVDLTVKGGSPLDNDGSIDVDPTKDTSLPVPEVSDQGFDDDYRDPGPTNLPVALPSSAPSEANETTTAEAPSIPLQYNMLALSTPGRGETCIVNAAIMASSWPHRGSGGKKFNKPIVVDLDLPIDMINAS